MKTQKFKTTFTDSNGVKKTLLLSKAQQNFIKIMGQVNNKANAVKKSK